MSNRTLRDLLHQPGITRAVGAHDSVGARLIEDAGFDAVWASGLEISAARGVPDTNILSVTEVLGAASAIAHSVNVPVLADCDSGFGNVNNVIHMVRAFEEAGVAGVCIEDKVFPKVNSFIAGGQDLEPRNVFAAKIKAAVTARTSRDFVVVARLEALIAGHGMEEALQRAELFEAAGADALLIHSKQADPGEVVEFRRRYDGALPVVIVPTTYYGTTATEFEQAGFAMAIYANQLMRSSITAMKETLASIREHDSTADLEPRISAVKDIFALQRVAETLALQRELESFGDELAATAGQCEPEPVR